MATSAAPAAVKKEGAPKAVDGGNVGGSGMTNTNGVYGWKNIALGGKRGTVRFV